MLIFPSIWRTGCAVYPKFEFGFCKKVVEIVLNRRFTRPGGCHRCHGSAHETEDRRRCRVSNSRTWNRGHVVDRQKAVSLNLSQILHLGLMVLLPWIRLPLAVAVHQTQMAGGKKKVAPGIPAFIRHLKALEQKRCCIYGTFNIEQQDAFNRYDPGIVAFQVENLVYFIEHLPPEFDIGILTTKKSIIAQHFINGILPGRRPMPMLQIGVHIGPPVTVITPVVVLSPGHQFRAIRKRIKDHPAVANWLINIPVFL